MMEGNDLTVGDGLDGDVTKVEKSFEVGLNGLPVPVPLVG